MLTGEIAVLEHVNDGGDMDICELLEESETTTSAPPTGMVVHSTRMVCETPSVTEGVTRITTTQSTGPLNYWKLKATQADGTATQALIWTYWFVAL